MSLRDRIRGLIEAMRHKGRKEAIKELKKGAKESTISVLDGVVSAIAGHSVRTQPTQDGPQAAAPIEEPSPHLAPESPSSSSPTGEGGTSDKPPSPALSRREPSPKPASPSPTASPRAATHSAASKEVSPGPARGTALPPTPSRSPEQSPKPAELVLLVRDPDWLFAYWSWAKPRAEGVMLLIDDQAKETEQPIELSAGHAFVRAPASGRTYRASLYRDSVGGPLVAVSSEVFVPTPEISPAPELPKLVAVGRELRAVPRAEDAASRERVASEVTGVIVPQTKDASSSPTPFSSTALDIAPSSWSFGSMPTSPGR